MNTEASNQIVDKVPAKPAICMLSNHMSESKAFFKGFVKTSK